MALIEARAAAGPHAKNPAAIDFSAGVLL